MPAGFRGVLAAFRLASLALGASAFSPRAEAPVESVPGSRTIRKRSPRTPPIVGVSRVGDRTCYTA